MNILLLLAPFSVFLGLMAVAAFVWTLRAGQYDDIRGAAERILLDDADPIPARPDPEHQGPGASQADLPDGASGSDPDGPGRNQRVG